MNELKSKHLWPLVEQFATLDTSDPENTVPGWVALERWRERRTRGERGCFSLLFASLPAIVIWAVVIVLWLQPWKP